MKGLDLSKYQNLGKILEGFDGLMSLETLSFQRYESLEEFHVGLSNLSTLE